jgi:flagellar assembly protein FliH
MDISSLPADQVATLISQVLSDADPATVGLRRIITKKNAEQFDYPLRTPVLEDFDVPGKVKKVLTDDERRIIELERWNIKLKEEIRNLDASARSALQKAYAHGVEEGARKGREQGIAETAENFGKKEKELQDQIASFLKKLENEKRALYADADQTLLALCLQIVRKILVSEPSVQPGVILAVLKKALSYISERDKIAIRVSPGDFKTVTENRDFWTPVNERLKNISIEEDERIERGGCIIESGSGKVDARVGVQLDEITDLIETALENGLSTEANTPEAENG